MPFHTLSPQELAYFDTVGSKLPMSHRFIGGYAGEAALSGLHVQVPDPLTGELKPGLRLYRGTKTADIAPVGLLSSGAPIEPRLFRPNPVQQFVEAVHDGDATVRDGMIGSHVNVYAHRQKHVGEADFASPFLSTSPSLEVSQGFAAGSDEALLEMHVPMDRLVISPVYNMGRVGELPLPRDVLVVGGVATHEIVAIHESGNF